MVNVTASGPTNAGRRRYASSSIGPGARHSISRNPTPASPDRTNSAITQPARYPAFSPPITANTTAASAPEPTTNPARSSRVGCGSALSGTNRTTVASSSTPHATLNQNTARQPPRPTRAPPTTGPSASASPHTAAQAVAEGAGGEHQAGEHQRVPVHHPLQLGHRGVQIRLHRAQRDGHDGGVQ